MNFIKKIFLISIFVLIIIPCNLNAANLLLGAISQFGMSGANTNSSKIFPSSFRDFDSGFSFSIGLNQPISSSSKMFFSLLLDLGYYHDSYDLKYVIEGKRATENYQFESFLVGGYARFNFGFIKCIDSDFTGTKDKNLYYNHLGLETEFLLESKPQESSPSLCIPCLNAL